MITLYDYVLSGNCYKVRLLASLLDLEIVLQEIDFHPGKEHKGVAFHKLNPLGELPVVRDGNLVIRDAQAILVHIASNYDASGTWYPTTDVTQLGPIQQWLSFADLITRTASAARLHDMLGYQLDIDAARSGARRALRILDDHLNERELLDAKWICGSQPSIADIACFPYIALSEDGGVSLEDFDAIRRWIMHIKRLDGFITMPGISPVH